MPRATKLSEEALEDIRSSREILKVVAHRWDISIKHASDIRSGRRSPLPRPTSPALGKIRVLEAARALLEVQVKALAHKHNISRQHVAAIRFEERSKLFWE